MSENGETCFVIMPFSKTAKHSKAYWTKHFKSFLKPLIEENLTLQAHRSEALRGDILRQIITDLVNSRVVVADLTDHNCNVYWELGVRQSFKHGTVTIAEAGTQLPFDISGKGTLSYNPKDHIQMEEFRESFKKAVQDCLVNPDTPDSHVLETLGGRGTLFEIFRRDEAIRRLNAVLLECDRNSEVMKILVGRAKANQENPDKREYRLIRPKASALELLITNRYVNEDQKFFENADTCARLIAAVTERLSLWYYEPDHVEEWLLETEERVTKVATVVRASVEAAREKLSKQF